MDIHIDASQSTNSFECTECDYKCAYIEIFNEHKKTHTQQKPGKVCGCDFQSDIQTHTGERTKQCDKCDGASSKKTTLKDHILLHNDEKPNDRTEGEYKCTHCQYICLNEDILISHLKSHSIYICNKCDFEGKTQQTLSSHSKVHNKKILKCPSCDFTCTNLVKLNAHKNDHIIEDILIEHASPNSKASKRNVSLSPKSLESESKTSKKTKNNTD